VALTPPARLLDCRFRASPDYELRTLGRRRGPVQLPSSEHVFGRRAAGLLKPMRPGPPVRLVDAAGASLWRELTRPLRLSSRARASLGARPRERIAELVLDGVLEVECSGRFVSGAAAHPLFFPDADAPAPESRPADLSLRALRYAAALGSVDARLLASRLYGFNTLPASPDARRRWPDGAGVAAFLRPDRYAHDRSVVPSTSGAWFIWRVRGASRPSRSEPCYKLYVSPHADRLPAALDEVVPRLADVRAFECKVGGDIHGLLRPDKLVVYFRTLAALEAAARRWARALAGMPPHGVPFTADLGGDGLLSWGLDPPGARRGLSKQGPSSWRDWITQRLAEALVAARDSIPASVPAWRFALDRVALAGVDTRTWTPAPWLRRTAAFG